jgi:hypothetical protein
LARNADSLGNSVDPAIASDDEKIAIVGLLTCIVACAI